MKFYLLAERNCSFKINGPPYKTDFHALPVSLGVARQSSFWFLAFLSLQIPRADYEPLI